MFSPTASVRISSRHWMDTVPPIEAGLDDDDDDDTPKNSNALEASGSISFPNNAQRSVSISNTALAAFASQITNSIVSNKSLEVAAWDDGEWHYTGKTYRGGEGRTNDDSEMKELNRMERVALYILSMDAINFCFWPLSDDASSLEEAVVAGTKTKNNKAKNGLEYEHLAIALRKVAEYDDACFETESDAMGDNSSSIIRAASSYQLSPANLAALTPDKLKSLLQPHFPPSTESQRYELPNIDTRCQLLNELGKGLLENHDGSALHMISKANQSADALVRIIMDTFPGFRDYVDTKNVVTIKDDCDGPLSTATSCDWDSAKTSPTVIHFYKRAQIAVADIWAALGRCQFDSSSPAINSTSLSSPLYNSLSKCCHFTDMSVVTTFPDYRVPQILRNVGVMKYASSLAKAVDDQKELEKGGMEEISIRAATVVAVEDLVLKVKEKLESIATSGSSDGLAKGQSNYFQKLAEDVSAVTIDWYLWQQGEKLDRQNLMEPHHRVRTTFY